MALSPGTRLGPYEIANRIGAGGMGEVYRARDTKLNRDVAIKVLLAPLANEPDRIARFSREAQVLASLNHPNIAHVHGFEESGGVGALVMELVEGPTLADRISEGAISLDEALPIAKQITEGVEAAHDHGIIHRDLKPANIKIKNDGTVKVLDFGLAKALEPVGPSSANVTSSPTFSVHGTQAGLILGTAAYMAPEQARGKAVDKRADIWAFGCVLFEMLSGKRAFGNDDVTDTIVAVLSKEPDWRALPAKASHARPLLSRCLKKDPKQRLQAIGDARIHIEELIGGTPDGSAVAQAPVTRRVGAVALAALVAGASIAGWATWMMMRSGPQTRAQPTRFEFLPPPAQSLAVHSSDRDITISPDGQIIVYRGGGAVAQLIARALDRLDVRPLPGIESAREPFFSPDGEWIGFFDGSGLKKAPVAGGPVVTLWKTYLVPRGASWGDDNRIVFASADTSTGLLRIAAGGGEPATLTKPDAAKRENNHWQPSVLPGARGVLFTIGMPNPQTPHVAVLDLATGQYKTLFPGSQAQYVETGHLLYVAAGSLYAVRFDLEQLKAQGDPVAVLEEVMVAPAGAANYAVSRTGTLVYVAAAGAQKSRSIAWVDRNGRETPIAAPTRAYTEPRLSPDGSQVALTVRDQENDIWIWDLVRQTLRRLTFGPGVDQRPVWTADGRRVVFASSRAGSSHVFMQAADGTGPVERLTTDTVENHALPAFVPREGFGVLGSVISPRTNGDIVWFPRDKPGEAVVRTTAIEYNPEVSPDGRYIAYQSNESGREEIYVRPFPRADDGRWQVSMDGGSRPVWARNGRELYYLDVSNTLMAVSTQTSGATFAAGNPVKLFEIESRDYFERDFDVSADGARFLITKQTASRDRSPRPSGTIVVVLNWFEELRAKLPAPR